MSKSKKEILIIEDDPQSSHILEKTLTHAGYRVSIATTLDEAFEKTQKNAPHLILLDLVLGKESGFDYLQKHFKMIKNTPLIVITGLKNRETFSRSVSLGAIDYILKPFDLGMLVQKVRKALKSREFISVPFPEALDPKAKMISNGKIVHANEFGFLLEIPVKIHEDSVVQITSPLFRFLSCESAVFRRTKQAGRLASVKDQFLNEINVTGLAPTAVQRIKTIIKEWK